MLRTPEIFSSDLSLPQSGQHSAYLRAREASDQLQQLQLMSDLLSLSVRPEEGTSTPTYTKDGYLNTQPQISRSLSSSFDGSRCQIQNQFAGLVGYQPDNEENRISHREDRDRDREFLAADTSDTIGDMDIGTIDLSFALASDVDADVSMTADATVKADAPYGLNERTTAHHAYDYMALSQYSNSNTQTHQQSQHLSSSSHIHNIYLAADEGDSSTPYSQSPYYTDYTTVLMSSDLDQSIPRARGFSSGSQLDLSAQSQSGLSPNAPSFNPNTLNLWSGCQDASTTNPFEQDTRPHGIGLMDSDATLEYTGTLDYSAHIQQQLQHQFYQDSLTQQQTYDGHFSPYISITQPQQLQHPLTMYYPQGVEQLHQSLLSTGLNTSVTATTSQSTYTPSQSQFSTVITGRVEECSTDETSYIAS